MTLKILLKNPIQRLLPMVAAAIVSGCVPASVIDSRGQHVRERLARIRIGTPKAYVLAMAGDLDWTSCEGLSCICTGCLPAGNRLVVPGDAARPETWLFETYTRDGAWAGLGGARTFRNPRTLVYWIEFDADQRVSRICRKQYPRLLSSDPRRPADMPAPPVRCPDGAEIARSPA